MCFIFLISPERSEGFHREASTIKPFVFLKFDVAKLGRDARESKKTASTIDLVKTLIISIL